MHDLSGKSPLTPQGFWPSEQTLIGILAISERKMLEAHGKFGRILYLEPIEL